MSYPPQQPPWPPERPVYPPPGQQQPWPGQGYPPPPVPPRYPPPPPPGYQPPPAPPGRRSRPPRKRRGWLIALGVLAAVLVIGAIGSAIGKPAPAKPAAPNSAAAAATSAAPSPSSCRQTVIAWKDTMAWTYFRETTADAARIQKAASAGEMIAVEQDSADLAAAARDAKAHPIPSCADAGRYYPKAMGDWQHGGKLAAGGNFTAAAAWITQGTRVLAKADVELNEVVRLEG